MLWMQKLIYASLVVLVLGLITSMSLLGLSHILMIVPCLYFIPKTNWRELPYSFWALLGLCFAMLISVFVNRDTMVYGFSETSKIKYYIFGLLMVAPFSWYFHNYYDENKIKKLIYLICIASLVAGFSGTIARYTRINPILWKMVQPHRNSGLSGMVLNYAHNLAYFEVIIFGLFLAARKKNFHLISEKYLYTIFVINIYFLYTSYTRGALVALVAGLVSYLIKKKKLFFSLSFISIFSLLVAYQFSGKTMIRPMSDIERLSHWKASIKAFEEKPAFGYGYLNFEPHSLEIKKKYNIDILKHGHAHNNFLEILASTGLVGFFFFISWMLLWFFEMYNRSDLVSQVTLAFIVAFLVGGMGDASIILGFRLFFLMAVYSLSQQNPKIIKDSLLTVSK